MLDQENIIRKAARFFSVVFHPLLIVTYILILLLLINPYQFGVNSFKERSLLIVVVFFSTFFIPLIGVVMMKALGFIQSFEMEDRMERIIPYVFVGIFYVAFYYYSVRQTSIPPTFSTFMLGTVIALFTAFFINNFSKISIHAVGMGGLLGAVVLTMTFFKQHSFLIEFSPDNPIRVSMVVVLMLVILIAGLVGTSRLLLKAHRPIDLWGGYAVGFGAQLLALQLGF